MVFLIVCLIVYIYFMKMDHPLDRRVLYEDISNFKTGDIILFHALDNINTILIGCYYGHIGMVYIDPHDPTRTPYIFEAFNPKNSIYHTPEHNSGVVLAPLENRIKTYRGYCFYKELNKPLPVSSVNSLADFILYATKNMYYDSNVVSSAMGKILFNNRLNIGTNCGELMYLSLIKLDLLPLRYLYENNKHHLRFTCNVKKLNNGYEYKTPVFVYNNYFK